MSDSKSVFPKHEKHLVIYRFDILVSSQFCGMFVLLLLELIILIKVQKEIPITLE